MSQNITAKQRIAILALAAGRDIADAASEANVARETVSRWLAKPEIKAELARVEGDIVAAATRRLANLLNRSTEELEKLVTNPNTAPGDRLRAININILHYPRLAEIGRVEDRLTAIEELLENGDQ